MPSKFTFITRHYPPNPNINGESVRDMVKYFEDELNIESNIICIHRGFEGGGEIRTPAGHVIRMKTLYKGKNPLLRFITFLYDGFILARRALHYNNTLLVCTTSPPLLPMWASKYFKIKWALWAFDLFPEGFKATHLAGETNLFYRWAKRATYKRAPSFLIALGPRQAAYIQQQYQQKIPLFILPCGLLFYQDKSTEIPEWRKDNKIYLGYCGNLGDPHNPDFIKAIIDNIDPEKHRLVLAIYGNKSDEIKDYAAGKPGIIIVDRVSRNQLHFIDIHLVTLRTEWTHIAVPSKAVSAISLNCPILFCGSAESDNWYMLQKAGWLIREDDRMTDDVRTFMQSVSQEEIIRKKEEAVILGKELNHTFMESYRGIAAQVS